MNHAKQIDDLAEALASTESELRDAREALARVEAEHATWTEQYDSVVRYGNELLAKHDTAQAQLADVLYILDQHRTWTGMGWEQLPVPVHAVEKIRSKLAQAEQQEARAAKGTQLAAGEPVATNVNYADEVDLIRAVLEGYSPSIARADALCSVKLLKAYFAAPPAAAPVAAGEPVYQVSLPDGTGWSWYNASQDVYHQTPPADRRVLYTAPPAAAHGDEAVRKDAERYRWIANNVSDDAVGRGSEWHRDWRRAWRLPLLLSNNAVADKFTFEEAIDAAMRAQGDGEVQ